ncbi:hypothetical protein LNS90_RS24840, partial [Escherichia coli]
STKRFRHTASSARSYSNCFPVRHNPFHAVIFLYPEQENTRELSHPNASGFPSTGFVLLPQNAKCLK